jgi:hypothetical protein
MFITCYSAVIFRASLCVFIDMLPTFYLYLQIKGEVTHKWQITVLKLQVQHLLRNLVRNCVSSCLVKICVKECKNV